LSQSATLEGRRLFVNVVVANETIDEIKRKKERCVIVKVYYEKTYDSMK